MAAINTRPIPSRWETLLHGNTLMFLIMAALMVIFAWPAVFSTFALYDDEGYVMMTLQTFLQGHRLYGDTHTQYGPAFYFLIAPIHGLLGWPLTHDGIRFKTMVVWFLAVWLSYVIVRRMSQSPIAALVTALLAAIHLDKLTLEPGHPQEVTLLGTLLVLALFTRSSSMQVDAKPNFRTITSWCAVGFLAGLVGLVKLNCGAVLAVPLLIAAAVQARRADRGRWFLLLLLCAPSIAIAWAARSSPLSVVWVVWLTLCASLLVGAATAAQGDIPRSSLAPLLSVMAGGAFAVGLILGLAFGQGNSLQELWFGLVGQHADFADYFFRPIGLSFSALAGLLVGIGGLWIQRAAQWQAIARVMMWGWVAVSLAATAAMPLEHGMHPRGAGLFLAWAAPAWIVWFWKEEVACSPKKLFLALVAILSPLIAFPVSGTQVQVGTLPALIVVGVVLGEYLAMKQRQATILESHPPYPFHDPSIRLILGSILCGFFATATVHWYRYASGEPLGLAGSAWLRLPSGIVEEQQKIVDAIAKTKASHLVFEGNNHNRFYFWTDLKPLTSANPTFWPVMLLDREQQDLARAIDGQSRLCVVRVPNYEWLYFDHAPDIRENLRLRWQETEWVGDWQIGVTANDASAQDSSHTPVQ